MSREYVSDGSSKLFQVFVESRAMQGVFIRIVAANAGLWASALLLRKVKQSAKHCGGLNPSLLRLALEFVGSPGRHGDHARILAICLRTTFLGHQADSTPG